MRITCDFLQENDMEHSFGFAAAMCNLQGIVGRVHDLPIIPSFIFSV